jgi:uncharacterized protein (TIGR00266 family)
MQHSISNGPYHATLDLILQPDEEVLAEPDVMLAMSPTIEISVKTLPPNADRFWGSARMSMVGERIFTATFRAKEESSFLTLAPRVPGNILHLATTDERTFYLSQGSFLACSAGVSVTFRQARLRGVLSRKGLNVLEAEGTGDVFCSVHGALMVRELQEDESFVIDNRFVVAFSNDVQLQLVRVSKDLASGTYPGGGLLNQYTGPGTVYYQTRANPLG